MYEHCVRAILESLSFGENGLQLIGSGDWNDGMNAVGEHGKGESVWLGFFLYELLMRFAEVANTRGDNSFAVLLIAKSPSKVLPRPASSSMLIRTINAMPGLLIAFSWMNRSLRPSSSL